MYIRLDSLASSAKVLFQMRIMLEFRGKCSSCGAASADLAGKGRRRGSAHGANGAACRPVAGG